MLTILDPLIDLAVHSMLTKLFIVSIFSLVKK